MDLLLYPIRFAVSFPELIALVIGHWLVSSLAERRALRHGITAARWADLSWRLAMGGIVGARLPSVLPHLEAYLRNPLDLLRINMGLHLYAGLAGAVLVGLWQARRHQFSFWELADAYFTVLPLGIALYRMACLVAGDCYGKVAPPPVGVLFPGLSQPRYPSELYEAVIALTLAGWFWWGRNRWKQPGTTAILFFFSYPLARAVVDLTRIDIGPGPLSVDQIISLVIAMSSASVYLYRRRRTGPPVDRAPAAASAVIQLDQP